STPVRRASRVPSLENFGADRWGPPCDFHPPRPLCPSPPPLSARPKAKALSASSRRPLPPPPTQPRLLPTPAVRTRPSSPPFPTLILTGGAIVEPAFMAVCAFTRVQMRSRSRPMPLRRLYSVRRPPAPFGGPAAEARPAAAAAGGGPRRGDFEDEAQGLAPPQSKRKRAASQLLLWPR
ncbi:hypothetical protein EJB05_31999, partial [Eragrostis curvula]